MKVVFICGCIEEGKDGIGDYTKKLSLECSKNGITPLIIAINDPYVTKVQPGVLNNFPYVRIPADLSIKERELQISGILSSSGSIDWISFQFVSYGLNKKGLVYRYIKPFTRLFKGYKLQIMFHELWVGEEKQASFKMKLSGIIQKIFILKLVKSLQPQIIQTSVALYMRMLENAGINASVLPLFSNINHHKVVNNTYLEQIPGDIITNRKDYLVGCIFGSIYYKSWDMASLFHLLEKKNIGKKVLLISVGKIGVGEEFWKSLPVKYPQFEFLTLGIQDEAFISNLMQNFIDFGILTTPPIIAGKSGSYMAFLEHGIPVFSKNNELSFNFDTYDIMLDEQIIKIDEKSDLIIPVHSSPISLINNTAKIFVDTLKRS